MNYFSPRLATDASFRFVPIPAAGSSCSGANPASRSEEPQKNKGTFPVFSPPQTEIIKEAPRPLLPGPYDSSSFYVLPQRSLSSSSSSSVFILLLLHLPLPPSSSSCPMTAHRQMFSWIEVLLSIDSMRKVGPIGVSEGVRPGSSHAVGPTLLSRPEDHLLKMAARLRHQVLRRQGG